MKRRGFLKVMLAVYLLPLANLAKAWNKAAFESERLQQAENLLKMTAIKPSNDIELIIPDAAENGAVVQAEVISHIPNTQSITMLVENNPTPLIARFLMEEGSQGHVITRIKMAATSNVKVVVNAGGQFYYYAKQVTVLEDGCGGADNATDFISSIKIRAIKKQELTEVKAIIVHPMTTGRGKNSAGETVPAHFIQTIQGLLNDKPVIQIETSTAISKNPYLTFYLSQAKVGDTLEIKWLDNKGLTGQGKVIVAS